MILKPVFAAAHQGVGKGSIAKEIWPQSKESIPIAKPCLTPKIWLTLALFGAIQQAHEKLERAVKR
jgi:hypothetical protein